MIFLGAFGLGASNHNVIVGKANHVLGTPLGAAPSNLQIAVSVGLFDPQMSDSLSQVLEALYSPQSSIYHNYLTSQQFSNLFAPTAQTYQQAVSYFRSAGLQVYSDKSRMFLNLDGTIAQFDNAFSTSVQVFRNGNVNYYTNTAPLYLPNSFASFVTSTIGFENYTYFAPLQATVPWAASQPPYVPITVQKAYNETGAISQGIDGTGQTVVLVDAFGDVNALTDITEFSAAFNLPVPSFTVQTVNASNTIQDITSDSIGIAIGAVPAGWDAETALDIEWGHAMAPGAKIVNMIGLDQGVGLAQAVATAIANHAGNVISQSFGLWEGDANVTDCCIISAGSVTLQTFAVGTDSWIQYLHPFYQMAAATGITVLASSGDSGSGSGCCSGNAPAVAANYPAADSFVTAVGGTSLFADSNGYIKETAWSGSGGGFSTIFSRPSWQTGPGIPVNVPVLPNGALARGEPDIAAVADPSTGVIIVVHGAILVTGIGGTSVASPVWGGIIATLNTRLTSPEGFYNPTAYSILKSPTYCGQFHDTQVGSNGAYSAGPGWDPVTGVGSPNVGFLVNPSQAPTCSGSPGVTITSPTPGQTITTSTLTVTGTMSLGPGNYVVGLPNSAPGFGTGIQQNQLNILAGWITNYRVINGQGFFDAKLNMSDLTNLSLAPAGSTGEAWYLLWKFGAVTWFATMQVTFTGSVSGGPAGIGLSFGIGQLQGSFYNTTNTAVGSYTATAPGTITVTVPTSLVGNPTSGSQLNALVAQTFEVVGFPVGALAGVDSASASDPYSLGGPLLPRGLVQVALNNNFQGATTASLVNYPQSNNWQVTVNLAGLSAGTQTIYVRQVVNEYQYKYQLQVPGPSASVSFQYSPPVVNPPSSLTVFTDQSSYTAKQNVLISGVFKNPTTGSPVSGATVTIEITDPLGTTVFHQSVTTNSTGGYATSFHISKKVLPGTYTVFASATGASAVTKFVIDSAPPTLSNVQVGPSSGNINTVFTVSASSTDDTAIFSVYALIKNQAGQVVEQVPLSHQTVSSYSASFTLPSTAVPANYVAEVHSTDVAGRTAIATSNLFSLTP